VSSQTIDPSIDHIGQVMVGPGTYTVGARVFGAGLCHPRHTSRL